MVQLTGDQTAGVDFELLRTYPWCVAMNAAFLGRSCAEKLELLDSVARPHCSMKIESRAHEHGSDFPGVSHLSFSQPGCERLLRIALLDRVMMLISRKLLQNLARECDQPNPVLLLKRGGVTGERPIGSSESPLQDALRCAAPRKKDYSIHAQGRRTLFRAPPAFPAVALNPQCCEGASPSREKSHLKWPGRAATARSGSAGSGGLLVTRPPTLPVCMLAGARFAIR